MNKRALSLFLALAMLVLAVPVFALPTMAEATVNPTVEFRVGSTSSTNGMGDKGTIVKYHEGTKLAQAKLPTTADLSDAGLTYTAAEIITWAWWSVSDGRFYDIKDLQADSSVLAGLGVTDDSTLLVYPVFKESSSKVGVNNFYWEQLYTDATNTTKKTSPVVAYRGGWSIGMYGNEATAYAVASDVNASGIVSNTSAEWAAGGRFASGNIVSGYNVAPTVIAYQAMADGRITISIPAKASTVDYFVAVARNGVKVWPATAAGGKYVPSTQAEVATWQSIPKTTAAGTPDYTVSLDVFKGDVIHVMYEGAYADGAAVPSTAQISALPTIQYTEFFTEAKIGFALPSGEGDVVVPFFYSSAESITLPTDADLAAAGSDLTTDDIMGWYAYDPAQDRFIDVFQSKGLGFPNGTTFFPITWKSSFNNTSNSLLYDASDYQKPGNFRGGWTFGGFAASYLTDGYAYKTFDITKGFMANYILTKSPTGNEWFYGGINAKTSQVMAIGDTQPGLPALTWSALADGTVDITVPVPAANTAFAIAVNNTYIYPEALKEQTVGAPNATAKAAFTASAEMTGAVTVTTTVKAKDDIHFLVVGRGGTGWEANFFPTVAYQKGERGTPVAYTSLELYASETRGNRPQVTAGNTAINYQGGWDYTTYTNKGCLAVGNDIPLTDYLGNAWLVTGGATAHNSSTNACMSWTATPTPPYTTSTGWVSGAFSFNTKDTIVSTRYTAEYHGNIKVSFTTLGNYYNTTQFVNTHAYAIYVNGNKVWPANTDDWYTLSYNGEGDKAAQYGVNYADAANASMPGEIAVKKGQTVEFVIACSPELYNAWASRANVAEGRVVYTSIEKDDHTSVFGNGNRPTNIEENIGNGAAGENEPAAYPGAWDYISYNNLTMTNGKVVDTRYTISNREEWFVPAGITAYNSPYGSIASNSATTEGNSVATSWPVYSMLLPKGSAMGARYTAEYNGMVELAFDKVINAKMTNSQQKLTLAYAIYVDGVKVWPADDGWFEMNYYGTDVPVAAKSGNVGSLSDNNAMKLNASMPDAVYLQKGQTVEFMVGSINLQTYTPAAEEGAVGTFADATYSNTQYIYAEGAVYYTEVYTAPTAEAGLSVGESLSIYGQAKDVPVNATEFGVYLNGEKKILTTEANIFSVKVNAKEANADQTIKPYYVRPDSKVVMGEAYTITVNGMLNDYAASEDEATVKAAQATLVYTAAAEAYFNDETEAPAEIVEPTNRDKYIAKAQADKILNAQCPVESKQVTFRGISLLLNDLINIKIVINGTLPAGASLQIATDAAFTAPETVSGEATEDGTGTKFIMEGISAKKWNTDYYIRVVDSTGAAISDTLCYSVAAYYGRMIENDAATDNKLKAVISSLMALYEAVSEN